MQTSEQIGKLVTALALAQSQTSNPALDRAHPHFKGFRYASLGAHLEAIRQPFAANGLIVAQGVTSEGNTVTVTTMIAHSSGEWMKSAVGMTLPEKATAQNLGAVVTYLRRYAIASMCLLTGDDDTDADEDREARQPQRPEPRPAPAPTPAPQRSAAAERDALFGAAPKPSQQTAAWPADGTEVVTMRKVVDREGGVRAVLCDHPSAGQSWVQFPAELAQGAVLNKRCELTWEFDERGGFMRAVEVRAAPRMTEAMGGGK
jgi:hypothetical protein